MDRLLLATMTGHSLATGSRRRGLPVADAVDEDRDA
jgi:hypothetical protein